MPEPTVPQCEEVLDGTDLSALANEPASLDLKVQGAIERWLDKLQAHVVKARIRAIGVVMVDEDGDVEVSVADPLSSYPHEIVSGCTLLQFAIARALHD